MEADMKKLQDTADLFEVSFPEYKQLRQCRSDIILVKAVWDMVIFVKVPMGNNIDLDLYFYYIHISLNGFVLFIFMSVTVEYRGLDQDTMEGDQC